MSVVKHILAVSLLLLPVLDACRSANREDDEGRPLRASDRERLEEIITRARLLASENSDSCRTYAREAEQLSKAYGSVPYEIEALDILGGYYFLREDFSEALPVYDRLLELTTQTGDSLQKAGYYNQLGLVYYHLSSYGEALDFYTRATRIADQFGDNKLKAECYLNIGLIHSKLNNNSLALENLSQSLDLQRSLQNRTDEAEVLHNLGMIHAELRQYEEALRDYLGSIRISEEQGDTASMAQVFLSFGRVNEDVDEWDAARDHYTRALDFFTKEGNQSGIAASYYGLGSVSMNQQNYDEALSYFTRSLNLFTRISALKEQGDCHRRLAEIYALTGDNRGAYEEMNRYQTIVDTLFSERVSEQIAENEARLRSSLKDNEIASLRQERNRRDIGLIVILSLTAIVVTVTVYYTRTLRKANEDLQLEIEERMRAEKELISIKENLETRVAERTRELEKAKQQAEESDRLKSAFLANMSHEIRTPLNAITGYAGLLLRDDISMEKRKQYNDLIVKNNRLLLNVIEDLIDTSKLESGTLKLFPKEVSVDSMIEQLEEPLSENLINNNKLGLKVLRDKAEVRSGTVTTDPARVQQVMWHLLDNAVKYTAEGTIRYGCYENGKHVVFYVNDTGIGIPPESKDVIFEKFRQLDESTRRRYGGTGLGLYYARKIADILGGKVWFESKEEGGSIFYFSIPSGTPAS